MQINLSHAEYPQLFFIDLEGYDGSTEFEVTTTVPASGRTNYNRTNTNTTIYDGYLHWLGAGPIIGWYTGNNKLGLVHFYTPDIGDGEGIGYTFGVNNFTSSAITPAKSTQLYMMLPMRHVERVVYD